MIYLNNQMSYPVMATEMAMRQLTLKEIGDRDSSQSRLPSISDSLRPPKFNRLTLLGFSHRKKSVYYHRFLCECGNETIQELRKVKKGIVKSCGCYLKENRTTHDKSRSRIYKIWASMKNRCNNENYPFFHNYGGRGIEVCDEWENFIPFYEWSMRNGYENDLQIDRIDNYGNYNPENCRWTTQRENSRNRIQKTIVEVEGVKYRLYELAEVSGIPEKLIRLRLCRGDSDKDLIRPINKRRY